MKDMFKMLLTAVFPKRCSICGEIIEFDKNICSECTELPEVELPVCLKCGCSKAECVCSRHKRSVEYKAVIAPFYYEKQIQKGILNFKMHSMPFLAEGYGKYISNAVNEYYSLIDFDYVTYIPMLKGDERRREYNQSKLLADIVSEECELPLASLLFKKRKTKNQKRQSAKDRFINMYNAFDLVAGADVKGKTILLIDDVKTTGATLSSAALTLKAYGAANVYCAVLAIVK